MSVSLHRKHPFWVAALLFGILLAAADYWPVFTGKAPLPAGLILGFPPWEPVRGGTPLQLDHAEMGDAVTQIYPWRHFAQETLKSGSVPLWNPHLLLGSPFVANTQSAVFYPIHLLLLLLPTHLAWSVAIFARTVLAVLFTSLLARELGASRAGAMASGLIFAHCGFMVAWQVWPMADAALWLPLILYAVLRLRRRPTAGSVALTGGAFACPVLAGHPEVAIYTTLAGLAFWLFCLLPALDCGGRPRVRYVLLFGASGMLALGIASIQMLPTLEWVNELARSTEETWNRSRPPSEILSFFSRHARSARNPLGIPIPEGASYAGILSLMLAPLAFGRRRKAEALFFCVLLAAAAQVAYGFGPVFRLSLVTPVLKALPNNRLILLMSLSIAVLAGLGLTAVEERLPARSGGRHEVRWDALLWLTVLLSGAGLWLLTTRSGTLGSAAFGGRFGLHSSVLVFFLGASLLFLATVATRPLSHRGFAAGALVLLAADLLTFAQGHVPFFAAEKIFPEPPVYRYLREVDRAPFRIVALDYVSPDNAEMTYGLDTPAGYDFVVKPVRDLLGPFAGVSEGPQIPALRSERVATLRDNRLSLMNVRYFLTTRYNLSTANLEAHPDRFRPIYDVGSVQVFENLHALPRAFLVPVTGARVLPNDEAALKILEDPAFDPATAVLLTEALPQGTASGEKPGPSRVLDMELGVNRHRLRVHAGEPAVLVLSETSYPGWVVYVDGRREKLLRVDFAFKGVLLKPGEHVVEFAFESRAFRVGLGLSLVSVMIVLGLCVPGWVRRRNIRKASGLGSTPEDAGGSARAERRASTPASPGRSPD